MKSLFLAWQAPNRSWFPVGRLDADPQRSQYSFQYTNGALTARHDVGFSPLPAFPDFARRYESEVLFPLFENRVLDSHRKDFPEYLASLDLTPEHSDPIEILAVTGGERQTDSLEVFPKIEKKADGSFACRFFLHGWRYMPDFSRQRTMLLMAGEQLGVSIELSNPKVPAAIQITTDDYHFVGWTPRYLVGDLLKAIAEKPQVSAKVIRVNSSDVPANRRVLVELRGRLPNSYEPMSDESFQLVSPAH